MTDIPTPPDRPATAARVLGELIRSKLRASEISTQTKLARRAHVGKNTVSDLVNAKRALTWETVEQIAKTLDSSKEWIAQVRKQWLLADREWRPAAHGEPTPLQKVERSEGKRFEAKFRSSFGFLELAISISIILLLISVVTLLNGRQLSDAVSGEWIIPAGPGHEDPPERCINDARAIASIHEERFVLELVFSPHCAAAWGRITRTDNSTDGSITVDIYSDRSTSLAESRKVTREEREGTSHTIEARYVLQVCTSGFVTIGSHEHWAWQPACATI